MTSHFVQYRICLSRKAERVSVEMGKILESYQRFAKISNQQTFSFYTSIYIWTPAAENDSLAWKKTRENINALQSSVSLLWHCSITFCLHLAFTKVFFWKKWCKSLQYTEEFYWPFKQLKCSKLHLWPPPPQTPPPKILKTATITTTTTTNQIVRVTIIENFPSYFVSTFF